MSTEQKSEISLNEQDIAPSHVTQPLVMEHLGRISEMNREFDVAFWQAQDATARFAAAWDQVEFYYNLKGLPKDELRLQRSIEVVQRGRS
jgi:hypothetical protein